MKLQIVQIQQIGDSLDFVWRSIDEYANFGHRLGFSIAGVLVSISIFAFTGAGTEQPPVYLTLTEAGQATHFAIPKAYLSIAQNKRGGEQDFVKLSVSLPDIYPDFSEDYISIINTSIGADGVPIFHDQVNILLRRGRPHVKRRFRRDIETMTHNMGQEVFGLRKFKYTKDLPNKSRNGYFNDKVIYFVPTNNDENHGQQFRCYSKPFVKIERCRGSGDYNENLYYNYGFFKYNLKHWKVLDANVRALLELFERRARLANYPDTGG